MACSTKQPQITFVYEWLDFGDVVIGEIVDRDLKVSNLGDAPLIVEVISSSCGCTTATLKRMTVLPGDSTTLHIEFDSGAHGPALVGKFPGKFSSHPMTPTNQRYASKLSPTFC